jgi:hypothetical protein
MPLEIQGSGKITGLTDPAADSDAARKKFVEDKVAEVEISGDLGGLDDVNVAGAEEGNPLVYFDGEDAQWAPAELNIRNFVYVVEHDTDQNTARPDVKIAYWVGEVAPENGVDGDLWFDTSEEPE